MSSSQFFLDFNWKGRTVRMWSRGQLSRTSVSFGFTTQSWESDLALRQFTWLCFPPMMLRCCEVKGSHRQHLPHLRPVLLLRVPGKRPGAHTHPSPCPPLLAGPAIPSWRGPCLAALCCTSTFLKWDSGSFALLVFGGGEKFHPA